MNPEPAPIPSKKELLWRGFRCRCPKCGVGKLYQSYLKPVAACAHCGEDLSAIRADDGPAWLTVMVTGHLAVPVAIFLAMQDRLPSWQALPLMLLATLAMVLAILPRSKGIFIAMIWLEKMTPEQGNGKYDQLAKLP